MKKASKQIKAARARRSPEFKAGALTRAEQIGVAATAKELGLHESQLYGWRQQVDKKQQRHSVEHLQAAEIARLKRTLTDKDEELAILKKAAAYFAKHQK